MGFTTPVDWFGQELGKKKIWLHDWDKESRSKREGKSVVGRYDTFVKSGRPSPGG